MNDHRATGSIAYRDAGRNVVVVAVGYAAIAVGGLLRVPIVVDHLDVDGFASVLAVGALLPLGLLPAVGVLRLARNTFAEAAGAGHRPAWSSVRAAVRWSQRVAAVAGGAGTCGLLVWTLVSSSRPDAELVTGVAVTVVASTLAIRNASYLGALESAGIAHAQSSAAGVAAVVAVPVAWVLARIGATELSFVVLNIVTTLAPFLIARRWCRRVVVARGRNPLRPPSVGSAFVMAASSVPDTVRQAGVVLLLAHFATSGDVVEFTVAQRLSLATTLGFTASMPVLARFVAEQRGAGQNSASSALRVLRVQAVGSLIASSGFVLVAPPIATVLIGTPQPRWLYLWLGCLGVVWAVEDTLRQSATGHRGRLTALVGGATAAVTSVIGVVALADRFGATGAAFALFFGAMVGLGSWIIALWLGSDQVFSELTVDVDVNGSRSVDDLKGPSSVRDGSQF